MLCSAPRAHCASFGQRTRLPVRQPPPYFHAGKGEAGHRTPRADRACTRATYGHALVVTVCAVRLQFKLLNDVDTPNKYELPPDLEIDKLERSLAFCMPNAVLVGLGFQDDGISAAEKLQVVEDVDILCRIEEEIVSLRRGILKRQQNYNELLELFRTTSTSCVSGRTSVMLLLFRAPLVVGRMHSGRLR